MLPAAVHPLPRSPRIVVVFALLASLISFSLTAADAAAGHRVTSGRSSTACATTASPDFGIDLAGSGWRFRTGDDPAWAADDYADASWDSWTVPDDWGRSPDLSTYDGYAWYRKTFTLPERPEGVEDSSVIAALGFIDDADEAFLNGERIGGTGAFPPAFDSTWEVPREYYPPNGLLRWGAVNVLAVRMYDDTGGGGFYKGPVGLYSKAHLRNLSGPTGTAASPRQLAHACAVLDRQHEAVAAGDLGRYAGTLDHDFFHQGDTTARRLADVRRMMTGGSAVVLHDEQAEVLVDAQGRLVVDTVRSWATSDGTVLSPPRREFLYIDPHRRLELGDHSRFFRDSYRSAAMHRRVEFTVYLPPGYTSTTARRYPTVYMLHGFNGSNIEWEARDMDQVIDRLVAEKHIAQSVVIFPDGASGWWVDSSAGDYATMVTEELVPLVDRAYRTIPDRDHRGISGVSMGGQGAFTLGLTHPELFSSIASHMGALSLPPLAGTAEEQAAHASLEPLTLVHSLGARQLRRHSYYFDGGSEDDFGFGQAAIRMGSELAAKGIAYDYQGGPGRHEDAYWVPKLDRSFALHSKQFRAHPVHRPYEPHRPSPAYVWP